MEGGGEERLCGLGSYSLLFPFVCSFPWIGVWRIRCDEFLVAISIANVHYLH